jgi:hypothetical protein
MRLISTAHIITQFIGLRRHENLAESPNFSLMIQVDPLTSDRPCLSPVVNNPLCLSLCESIHVTSAAVIAT